MGGKTSTHLYTTAYKHCHSHRWLQMEDNLLLEPELNSVKGKCCKVKKKTQMEKWGGKSLVCQSTGIKLSC